MSDERPVVRTDHDAIHILPLSTIPLETTGLRRARLVKNARLDSKVELFADAGTGSGQITPSELYRVFDFDRQPHPDVELIETLSALPSFDVFSLRIHLRHLGIEFENDGGLSLSQSEKARLSAYMHDFLKPLMASIYDDTDHDDRGLADLVKLLNSPDTARAKQNLMRLARDLEISILDIPQFIQEYGDAYLSLSYYQYCFDGVEPVLEDLYAALDEIVENPPMNQRRSGENVSSQILHIKHKLKTAKLDIFTVMAMFSARTGDMWRAITAEKFRRMQALIREYQVSIGGALCTLSVKMMAWENAFPRQDIGSISRRADFVISEIGHGIDALQGIKYSDAG